MSNLDWGVLGTRLTAPGRYSDGTAVLGDVPLPQLVTSDEGDASVNILPTYQEVLFLIRVK
jgi:hypothetical protein